jgi:hypothetical protein
METGLWSRLVIGELHRRSSKQVSMSCRRLLLGVRGIYGLHVRDRFGRDMQVCRCDAMRWMVGAWRAYCSNDAWLVSCVRCRRQQSRKLINGGRSTNAPSVRPRALSSYRQGCGINDNDNPGAWQRQDKGSLNLDGVNPSRRMRALRALFCLRGHISFTCMTAHPQ